MTASGCGSDAWVRLQVEVCLMSLVFLSGKLLGWGWLRPWVEVSGGWGWLKPQPQLSA